MEKVTRVFELPYPPSVNHYWRRVGARTLISRGGRQYRDAVVAMLLAARAERLDGQLSVHIMLHPPDQRRRDLDNAPKALLDALQHGGLYEDDSQIDLLITRRGTQIVGGQADVRIERLPVDRCPLCGGVWAG